MQQKITKKERRTEEKNKFNVSSLNKQEINIFSRKESKQKWGEDEKFDGNMKGIAGASENHNLVLVLPSLLVMVSYLPL
jgi:hypothetical protein